MKYVLRKLTILDVLNGLDEFTAPIVVRDKTLPALSKWAKARGLTFKKDQNVFGGYYIDTHTGDCYLPHLNFC